MLIASVPVKFTQVWAAGAGGPYITVPVPTPSQIGITPGRASFHDGFVPLNGTPIASGGIPPFEQDFNGILQMITQWTQWGQAGGPIVYDGAFQASVSGYPQGAVVMSAVTLGLWWMSTADANTTDPDAGGAGWINLAQQLGPVAGVSFVSSAAGSSTTSTTMQPTGAVLAIAKKRASNRVIYLGYATLRADQSSSPNGCRSNMQLAQDSGGPYAALGSVIGVGALSGSPLLFYSAGTALAQDNGSLPASYNVNVQYCSSDGTQVANDVAAIIAVELWA